MNEVLAEMVQSNDQSVLATIIHVEGSAYRKEGATMLFKEDGEHFGIISAGCLEEDLARRAEQLLDGTRYTETIVYDMSSEDDLSWGRGAGCNGKVHILLEKVTSTMRDQFREVATYLEQRTPVVCVKLLAGHSELPTTFVTNNGHMFGQQDQMNEPIKQMALETKKSGTLYVEDFQREVYIQHYRPKPRLFLFGAGPDVIPLASMANQTGFSVAVWDWRPDNLIQASQLDVRLFTDDSVSETIEKINFQSGDSVVIMTHDFQKDKELLQLLLTQEEISYLGILGPRRRTRRLLNGEEISERLHSPVGLSIGAEGPEEIAISIIAELIQTKRQSLVYQQFSTPNVQR